MESSTYPNKKYIESSRMWVNVACHREKTHEVEALVGGKKVTVCTAYWNIPCKAHSDCYNASGNYPGITGLPTTVFTDPDGKEIGREVGGKSASELAKIQEKLLEKIPGEHISSTEWTAVKKQLSDAEAFMEKSEWKKAVEAYTKISKNPKKSLKELSTEGLGKLEAKGKVETEKDEAKKILNMVATNFAPLQCSKDAKTALKEIPADEKK